MTPRYARAPVGERAVAYRPVNRGKNVSMVGAVALRGVVALRSVEGAVNTAKFLRFLRHDLIPHWCPGDVLVMDNLRVHKAPAVRDLLAHHNIRVLFLPPYSPEFNPIEMYWSLFKRILRRVEARTLAELKSAIRSVRRRLSVDFMPLFRSCGFS
jgi:transposase